MRWIVVVLVFLLLFLAACAPSGENLVGEGYSSLSNMQKQAFWSCWRSACDVPLQQAQRTNDYAAYRSCSLDCYDQALKATQNTWCKDSDEGTSFFTPGVVTSNIYPQGKTDYCYTFPNSKTYLLEGICLKNKYAYVQKNCAELGAGWYCEPTTGTCVESSFPPTEISMQEIPVFNVKEFGAVADGTTNDGPAIQAALEKVAEVGGGKVFLPAGEYFVDQTLLIDNNTEIYGEGEKTILYRGNTWSYTPEYHQQGGIKNTVADLEGSVNCAEQYGNKNRVLMVNRAWNCGNKNIYLHDFVVDGSLYQELGGSGAPSAVAIGFSAVKDTRISHLILRDLPQDGIFLKNGGKNTSITDITVDGFNLQWHNGAAINIEMQLFGNFPTQETDPPVLFARNTIIARGPGFCQEDGKTACDSSEDCSKGCEPRQIYGVSVSQNAGTKRVAKAHIVNNTFLMSDRHGAIQCHHCQDSLIEGNVIKPYESGTAWSGLFGGISVEVAQNVTIRKNKIEASGNSNDRRGIIFGSGSGNIENNTVLQKDISPEEQAVLFVRGGAVLGSLSGNVIQNAVGSASANGHGMRIGGCDAPTSIAIFTHNTIEKPDALTSYNLPLVLVGNVTIDVYAENNITPAEKAQPATVSCIK